MIIPSFFFLIGFFVSEDVEEMTKVIKEILFVFVEISSFFLQNVELALRWDLSSIGTPYWMRILD